MQNFILVCWIPPRSEDFLDNEYKETSHFHTYSTKQLFIGSLSDRKRYNEAWGCWEMMVSLSREFHSRRCAAWTFVFESGVETNNNKLQALEYWRFSIMPTKLRIINLANNQIFLCRLPNDLKFNFNYSIKIILPNNEPHFILVL